MNIDVYISTIYSTAVIEAPVFALSIFSNYAFLSAYLSCQPGEGDGDLDLNLPEDYCGSCFGAKEEGCCQTCREVTDAYTAKGWTVQDIRKTAEQV